MKIKAAIFDVDGTLLDSMYYWRHMYEIYLSGFGKTPKPDLREKLKPLSLRESAELFQKEYGIRQSVEQIMAGINKVLEERYFLSIREKPYVREFLEMLQKKRVKICAATATDRYLVEAALKRLNLLHYFSRIYTCTEVGKGKEHPDIYFQAMEFLGEAQGESVVFEDACYAIKTAKNAGFYVVALADETAREDEAEIRKMADEYHESFASVEIEVEGRRMRIGAEKNTAVPGGAEYRDSSAGKQREAHFYSEGASA